MRRLKTAGTTTSLVILLHTEVQEKKSFVEAVQGALDNRGMARDLDRARMLPEDLRGAPLSAWL